MSGRLKPPVDLQPESGEFLQRWSKQAGQEKRRVNRADSEVDTSQAPEGTALSRMKVMKMSETLGISINKEVSTDTSHVKQ